MPEISSEWISTRAGEICALGTAVAWAVSVVLFRQLGKTISPFGVNFFKNVVGLALLLTTCLLVGQPLWPDVPGSDLALLLASGALGIGLADTLFLRGLNLLGASRIAVVECLYSPFVILFSWLLLSENLSTWGWIGAALVVTSVLTLVEKKNAHLERRTFWIGVGFSAASLALMAFGIVFVKPQLNLYPVLWLATIRMVGGVTSLLFFLPLQKDRAAVIGLFVPGPVWKVLLPTAILSAYISMLLWIGGMKYAQTNVSSILNQTSAVWIVLLAAIFLHEKLNWHKVVALVLALGGSALVLMS